MQPKLRQNHITALLKTLLALLSRRYLNLVLLGSQRSEELGLLLGSLEPSVSKLGRSIDEAKVDSLHVLPGGMLHQGLTQDQRTLLNTNTGTLDHDPVLTDHTVMDPATHGVNSLLGQVSLSLTGGIVSLLSDAVNLLVHLGTVEVTVLTGTWDSAAHTSRVPRSNTGNLTKTTVSLTRQTGNTPTGGNSLISVTLGNSDNIDEFILGKYGVNSNFLF